MIDITDLATSYPTWIKATVLALIVAIALLLVFGRQKAVVKQLVVDDIIVTAYPPKIDFRLRNPDPSTIAVTKILFKIVDFHTGPSPVGKQEISETAKLSFIPSDKKNDTIEVPVSVKVAGNDTDRIVVEVAWSGPTPDWGHFYLIVPALKTSYGFVRCKPIVVHIQEDFTKSRFHYETPDFQPMPPILLSEQTAEQLQIDWKKEESTSRVSGNE